MIYNLNDFLKERDDESIYISVIKNKPKLIISKGFFYYTNGELLNVHIMYNYYRELLDRLKNVQFTIIVECDNTDYDNPDKLNMTIIDAINECCSLSFENIEIVLSSIVRSFEGLIKRNSNIRVAGTIPEQGLISIIKFQIQKEKASSIILRKATEKEDYKTKTIESFLFKPINTFRYGKIETAFMLNEKPIV